MYGEKKGRKEGRQAGRKDGRRKRKKEEMMKEGRKEGRVNQENRVCSALARTACITLKEGRKGGR
jgi:predicted transposase YdaD